jgi:hypothetical protein
MEERSVKGKIIHRSVLRQCKLDDFTKKGVKNASRAFEKMISKRLCPDVEDEIYKVKNDYTNETLRNSFILGDPNLLECYFFRMQR